MEKQRTRTGRFLASRVYTRWKWTIRFGLFVLPMVLFLSGGLTVYFKPHRYSSTASFEYVGNRSLEEAAALLQSRHVVEVVARSRDLADRFGLGGVEPMEILSSPRVVVTRVNPATGFIELEVTNTDKEAARDMASEMINALESYEKSMFTARAKARIDALQKSVVAAEDEAAVKRQVLAKLMSPRLADPENPVSQLDIDAARAEWDHFNRQALENRARIAETEREIATAGPWVVIHSQPALGHTPVEEDETLGTVIWRSLGIGIGFALLAPYLMELAFPRRARLRPAAAKDWEVLEEKVSVPRSPVHG